MEDTDKMNAKGERSSSDPQTIPDQTLKKSGSLRLDFDGQQSASFFSQRSSSVDSSGSPSISSNGKGGPDEQTSNVTGAIDSGVGATSTLENNDVTTLAGGGGDASSYHHWACENESLPATLLNPEHQSTPIRDNGGYRSQVSASDERLNSDDKENEEGANEENDNEAETEKVMFLPGDLTTPIMGFETMESRSRFTVYKIHVQRRATDTDSLSSWFVFRRYSDFCHLNNRLKFLYPGFRLSLPPKRWFRDNFERDFLEDRVLGLQAFLDNITGHKDLCNCDSVRAFFCTDEPPGPHDSLEESRALCENLEDSLYVLRQDLQDKESEISLLKEELGLYKSQVELLTSQLRVVNSKGRSTDMTSPSSTGTAASLAECDRLSPPSPTSSTGKGKDGEQ